jgi:hypothetical protein
MSDNRYYVKLACRACTIWLFSPSCPATDEAHLREISASSLDAPTCSIAAGTNNWSAVTKFRPFSSSHGRTGVWFGCRTPPRWRHRWLPRRGRRRNRVRGRGADGRRAKIQPRLGTDMEYLRNICARHFAKMNSEVRVPCGESESVSHGWPPVKADWPVRATWQPVLKLLRLIPFQAIKAIIVIEDDAG